VTAKPLYRFLAPFTVAACVVVVGLLSRRGEVLALSLPLVLYCVAVLGSRAAIPVPSLHVSRTLDATRVNENQDTAVELTIANRGPDLPVVAVKDELPTSLDLVDGDTCFLGTLRAGDERTLRYSVRPERGQHRFGDVHVIAWPRLGFSSCESTISCASALSSLPQTEKLDSISIHPRRTHAFTGPVRANTGGTGLELFGCRSFTPGDDIRRINWRASARHDELIVTEYEQERMTDVNLILDARASVHVQTATLSTFDRAVQACASLAAHFIGQGNRVGLLTYGDYIDWIFPTAGRIQLERILAALAGAHLASRVVFEELRRIPTRLFASGSQLVIVSPLRSEEDFQVPTMLVARGYSVLLVYVDSLSLERTLLPDTSATRLAERLVRLKRKIVLTALSRAGAVVVDWDVVEPLNVALHHAQVRRTRGGRPR
jgi:uncharacterized protein (DUF58 family)